MFELIEKLRQKPERTKKQIAFLVSLSFVGIIFVIWLSVILPDFQAGQSQEAKVSKLQPSPVSSFEGVLSNGFSAIGKQFDKLKMAMTLFSTPPAYYSTTTTVSTTTEKQ